MNHSRWIVAIAAVALLGLVACQTKPAADAQGKKVTMETSKAKIGYAIGFNMGQNVRDIKDEIELDNLLQGIRDALAGDDKAQLNPDEMRTVLAEFQKKAQEIFQRKQQASGEKNRLAGEKFLAENGAKPGVVTTPSGLQYRVLTQGTGPRPKATDIVKVNYRGTLIDGTEFDSSYKRNQPATFPLNRVIPAWTEGMQLMTVGSKYMLFAPAALAYGDRGAGQAIGPNSVLIFEVELLAIEKAPAQPK